MKISIIIPAHNCEKYISQTLDCIRLQTIPTSDIEVLICLDGCTDNTAEIVKQYHHDHPNFNLRISATSHANGPAAARNALARRATGEYIHFMDADDLINAEFFESMYNAAMRNDADVAVCGFICERDPIYTVKYDRTIVVCAPQDKIDITRVNELGYSFRYLIRRAFWRDARLKYPTDLMICEDMLVMTRMIYASNRIVTVPNAVYWYRNRPSSLLNNRAGHRHTHRENYARATADVAHFINNHDLVPTAYTGDRYLISLFNKIPVFTVKHKPKYTWIKLFWIIPILKIKKHS